MRALVTVVGLLVLVGVIGGIKACQIGALIKTGKAMQAAGPPPEAVSTATARSESWEEMLPAIGTVTAVRGVTISNEMPGVVTAIHFDSGDVAKEGEVLVELDTSVERAQLASAEARRELARLNADRSRVLVQSASIPRAQLDLDVSTLETSRADQGALAAQIGRKVVRAPFGGRLGLRNVNLGQYLAPGTPITILQTVGNVFVDFPLPEQQLAVVHVGMPVHVRAEAGATVAVSAPDGGAAAEALDGKIIAIDPASDASTHTVKLRAALDNREEALRPGMYADVSVVLPRRAEHVILPLTSIVHAAYGDSVFVVEPKKDEGGKPVTGADGKPAMVARQQFVRLGEARGDFTAVLDGVKAGEEVVSAGAFKLRNGAGVAVDNSVSLKPKLDPRPENR